MPGPIYLDVDSDRCNLNSSIRKELAVIVCINLLHVSPWRSVVSLFKNTSKLLRPNLNLIIYGPFKIHCNHTSKSNMIFDRKLRNERPEWGLRDIDDIVTFASSKLFILENSYHMPSNNFLLVFSKQKTSIEQI